MTAPECQISFAPT